jgi:hypothetical protein
LLLLLESWQWLSTDWVMTALYGVLYCLVVMSCKQVTSKPGISTAW